MRRRRTHAPLIALVLALSMTACAPNKAPADAAVAHYGTTVLGAITELQKGVTAATDAGSLPVPAARSITTQVEKALGVAKTLGTDLQAYHAATTLDLKNTTAAAVQADVAAVTEAVSAILKVNIPSGVAGQITTLIGNVIQAVSATQAEVAKGLGGK